MKGKGLTQYAAPLLLSLTRTQMVVQRLKAQEVAPKGNLVPAGAARTMELTTTQESLEKK